MGCAEGRGFGRRNPVLIGPRPPPRRDRSCAGHLSRHSAGRDGRPKDGHDVSGSRVRRPSALTPLPAPALLESATSTPARACRRRTPPPAPRAPRETEQRGSRHETPPTPAARCNVSAPPRPRPYDRHDGRYRPQSAAKSGQTPRSTRRSTVRLGMKKLALSCAPYRPVTRFCQASLLPIRGTTYITTA